MVDFGDVIDFFTEIPSHIGDFFSGMFENIGEFSYVGLGFAAIVVIFIYALKDYMLMPFLLHMGSFEFYFWGALTYIVSGVVGYLVGKSLFDN